MRLLLILIIFSYPRVGLSQKRKLQSRNVYQSIQEVSLVENLSWEIIKRGFSFGNGQVSYVFQLDSTHKFKYVEFGDVVTITLDVGIWRIKNKNVLKLKSKKSKCKLDVLRFDKFLFYILPKQRTEFLRDFKNEQTEVAGYKMNDGDQGYTKEYLIAFHLMRKYFGTVLNH